MKPQSDEGPPVDAYWPVTPEWSITQYAHACSSVSVPATHCALQESACDVGQLTFSGIAAQAMAHRSGYVLVGSWAPHAVSERSAQRSTEAEVCMKVA